MTAATAPFHAPDTELFLIAADDAHEMGRRVEELSRQAEAAPLPELSLASQRSADRTAAARAGIVAGTVVELRQRLEQLSHLLQAPPDPGSIAKDPTQHVFLSRSRVERPPRVGFLFAGQGCQRVNMGRTLVERFPWARQMLSQAEQVLASVGAPAIGGAMFKAFGPEVADEDRARWFAALSDVEVAGPAIILTGALWARYFEILGVAPRAVGGHSQGEQMAFHAAGAVDFAGLMKLSVFLGRAGSPRYNRSTPGSMTILGCSADAARQLLGGLGGYAIVANINGPAQVVVAGEKAALEQLAAAAAARGIEVRQLAVSHAFHSDLVAEGGEYMRASGPRLPPVGDCRSILFSCVAARPVPAGTSPLDHFSDMATRPVDFEATVRAMAEEVDLFLELGAGRVLSGLVQGIDPRQTCLPVEPIPGRSRALHVALAALFAWGAPVRWDIVAMGLAPRS